MLDVIDNQQTSDAINFNFEYGARPEDSQSYIGDRHRNTRAAGGNGGHPFSEVKDNTDVYRIEFNYHKKDKMIKGLKLWYRDGSHVIKGKPNFGGSDYSDTVVDFDKPLEILELFKSNYRTGRLGGLILKLEGGGEHKIGQVSGSPEVIDTEGGRVLGIWGRDGADIDKMGFIISEHPASWRIEPDEDSWVVKDPDVTNVTLQASDFDECLQDDPVHCHAKYHQKLTRTTSYQGGFRIKVGAKVTFKAGVPIIGVGGEWEVHFEAETTHTWGNSESEDLLHEANWDSNVGPYERTIVEAIGLRGTATAEGKVAVIATYKDGSQKRFDNQLFSTKDADTFNVKMTSHDVDCDDCKLSG